MPFGSLETADCNGKKHFATYSPATARTFEGYSDAAAQAILIGDSYTEGADVDDQQTIAAQVFKITGIVSANLGVGGFGPVQAMLKAQLKRDSFPHAKIIILGIMYEDIRRAVNGYGPAFVRDDPDILLIRPYVEDREIRLVPKYIYDDVQSFAQFSLSALETDFWARPKAHFPYSVSFIRALLSENFRIRAPGRILKLVQKQYWTDYHDERLSVALVTVVHKFFEWAHLSRLLPAVIFIPQNHLDTQSASIWIQHHQSELTGGLVLNASFTDIDWSKYNRGPADSCHPSPYGYQKLAEFYSAVIRTLLGQSAQINLR